MKHHISSRRQRGFTLVEIAIVLMIVGLLIGGILRGQELIQSARVRNIIDQKSSIQTAYIGFMDRYRMLPGDLTPGQATVVGNGALASSAGGNGQIFLNTESTLFFQNLTAAGFISCGACMTVPAPATAGTAVAGPLPATSNSPVNVYGDFIIASNAVSGTTFFWFDTVPNINRLTLDTGASVPSQVLAEVDRKADDGLPGSGQFLAPSPPGPRALLAAAGGVLEKHPELQLDQLGWELGTSAPASPPTLQIRGAVQGLQSDDLRGARDAMARFTASLISAGLSAEVIRVPLDLQSSASINGSGQQDKTELGFEVKVWNK